jgi:hypothetical protein
MGAIPVFEPAKILWRIFGERRRECACDIVRNRDYALPEETK